MKKANSLCFKTTLSLNRRFLGLNMLTGLLNIDKRGIWLTRKSRLLEMKCYRGHLALGSAEGLRIKSAKVKMKAFFFEVKFDLC